MAKHQAVYPEPEELAVVMELVTHTERALKAVSDTMMHMQEGRREMVGVARVGPLAKGLLLAGDRQVELVVMCRGVMMVVIMMMLRFQMVKIMVTVVMMILVEIVVMVMVMVMVMMCQVELVVMCRHKPTVETLDTICGMLHTRMEVRAGDDRDDLADLDDRDDLDDLDDLDDPDDLEREPPVPGRVGADRLPVLCGRPPCPGRPLRHPGGGGAAPLRRHRHPRLHRAQVPCTCPPAPGSRSP
jgi:hypothetical protein